MVAFDLRFCLHFPNGSDDIIVSAAPADITTHQLMNIRLGMGMSFMKQTHGGTYLPGRAIATLVSVVFNKRRLQRMKIFSIGKPFDGDDFDALTKSRQGEAGI